MNNPLENISFLCKTAFEDVQEDLGIEENLWQKYVETEVLNNENLKSLIEKRDYTQFDWQKETPLGGAGTTLNGLLLYCLVRHFDMKEVIETGVSGGYYSAFMLAALEKNTGCPLLTSIELSDDKNEVGKLVPASLNNVNNSQVQWNLLTGTSSLDWFEKRKQEGFKHIADLYCHDSLHTFDHMLKELQRFKECDRDSFLVYIDDQKSDNFWNKCIEQKLFEREGYRVSWISGNESRVNGHIGGFIRYEKI